VRGGTPSPLFIAAYPSYPDLHAFRAQQFTFHLKVSAISAKRPACANHAVAWDARFAAGTHDVANGARSARLARERGDITVGRDATGRNTPDG
jgi:hypothetical protein